jgi:hypothetical protein
VQVPWARKEIENSLKEGDKTAAAAAEIAANTLAASAKESQPDASASDDKTESNKANDTKVIEHWATKFTNKFIIFLTCFYTRSGFKFAWIAPFKKKYLTLKNRFRL